MGARSERYATDRQRWFKVVCDVGDALEAGDQERASDIIAFHESWFGRFGPCPAWWRPIARRRWRSAMDRLHSSPR